MGKSPYAVAVDVIQRALRPVLKAHGYRVRGRTFNRATSDGLTQVVNLQMGPSDPPGTTYFPGLRENLHGLFTVNLGVYVPEVAKHLIGREAGSWVQEYDCCVRGRLAEDPESGDDHWWPARADAEVVDDVTACLVQIGLPFLERYATRDRILAAWNGRTDNMGMSNPPRIVSAVILAERGDADTARRLLAQQVAESRKKGHSEHVRQLAAKLGLAPLD